MAAGLVAVLVAGAAQAQARGGQAWYMIEPNGQRYVVNPNWGETLSLDFPATALEAGVSRGRAAIDCAIRPDGGLTDCRVTEETPGDLGLGRLTLDAASRARVNNLDPEGPGDLRVKFAANFVAPPPAVRFENAGAPPVITASPPQPVGIPQPRLTLVTMPAWARMPRGVLPEQAAARGLTDAFAGLRCRLEPNGALSECVVLSESTPGLGLGDAALAAARVARASPRTVDGAARRAEVLVWVPIDRAPAAGK
ncbi:hypothetical protein [Brevundimonas sp. GCM10030266]|uniref:hypothetical protein n=1 Tax=Brevundimonas sp. GCM10030266 TaxID=3273386 RepID=UPI0036189B69